MNNENIKTKIDGKRKLQIKLEAQRKASRIKNEMLRKEAWNSSNISAERREEYLKETPNYELLAEAKRRLINGEIEAEATYDSYPVRLRADEDYYLDIPYVLNNECGEFESDWNGEALDEYGNEGDEDGTKI